MISSCCCCCYCSSEWNVQQSFFPSDILWTEKERERWRGEKRSRERERKEVTLLRLFETKKPPAALSPNSLHEQMLTSLRITRHRHIMTKSEFGERMGASTIYPTLEPAATMAPAIVLMMRLKRYFFLLQKSNEKNLRDKKIKSDRN